MIQFKNMADGIVIELPKEQAIKWAKEEQKRQKEINAVSGDFRPINYPIAVDLQAKTYLYLHEFIKQNN